jgi:HEAT repeat protein
VYFLTRDQEEAVAPQSMPSAEQKPADVVAKGRPEGPEPGQEDAASKPQTEKGPAVSEPEDGDWIAQVTAGMNSQNLNARYKAIWLLQDHPSPEAVDLLTLFLKDENPDVVEEAIGALAFLVRRDGRLKDMVYDVLAQKAGDQEFVLRGEALVHAAIVAQDNRVLPLVEKLIQDDPSRGKAFASRTLTSVASAESVPYLKVILEETEEAAARRNALATLMRIESPDAVALLQEHMLSEEPEKQAQSTWALSRQNKPEHNEVLTVAMAEGRLSPEAVANVVKSPAAPTVFGGLLSQEELDKERKVELLQALAADGLYNTEEVRAELVSVIEPLLESADPDLEVEAIKALGQIGGGQEAVDLLEPKLDSSRSWIREEALYAMVPYLSPRRYKPMLEMLWDDEESIRRTALMLAAGYVNDSDRPTLEEARKHPDEFISKKVVLILDHWLPVKTKQTNLAAERTQ